MFPKYRVIRDDTSNGYVAEKRVFLFLWKPLKFSYYKETVQEYCEKLAKEEKPSYLSKNGTWSE